MYRPDGTPGLDIRPPEPSGLCCIYTANGKAYIQGAPGTAPGTKIGGAYVAPTNPFPLFSGGGSTYTQGGQFTPTPTTAKKPAAAPATAKKPGVLTTPGYGEQQWWETKKQLDSQLLGLSGKSNTQALYDSGDQGMTTWYDREHKKRQKRLGDQMSAMGIFDGGSGAKALYELEAEMGSQQSRDMADLGFNADSAEMARAGQRQGISRDLFSGATGAQNLFENRESGGLRAKQDLANSQSQLFTGLADKGADEQRNIMENVIQGILASGEVGRAQAEEQAGNLLKIYGIVLKSADLYRGTGGTAGSGGYGPAGPPPEGTGGQY